MVQVPTNGLVRGHDKPIHGAKKAPSTFEVVCCFFSLSLSISNPLIPYSLGGGNSNILYVHPYLGKIPSLTIIFQMGGKKLPTSSDISDISILSKSIILLIYIYIYIIGP